jgi:hypothetical protein
MVFAVGFKLDSLNEFPIIPAACSGVNPYQLFNELYTFNIFAFCCFVVIGDEADNTILDPPVFGS